MILEDRHLREWAKDNVDPYDPTMVNSASIDLKLSGWIRIPMWYWHPATRRIAYRLGWRKWSDAFSFDQFTLHPGRFVLCSSFETTKIPNNCAAALFSKSSVGRTGIEHLHAGYGDPGFHGQWTWELTNVAPWPNVLKFRQPLMQLVLVDLMDVPEQTYAQTGYYQGQWGPTPARKGRMKFTKCEIRTLNLNEVIEQ